MPGDSCINQLLLITHEIYKSFDDGWEIIGVFLGISKAFDKVWRESLLLKLKLNGISGILLKILGDFLANRYERVVLKDKSLNGLQLEQEFHQGSTVGPLLFLIYINDFNHLKY